MHKAKNSTQHAGDSLASAEEYLATLKANALRNPKYRLQLGYADLENEQDALDIRMLRERAKAENRDWDFPENDTNPHEAFKQFEKDIPSDALARLPDSLQWVVQDCLFGILPLGIANGHALSFNSDMIRLDKSITLLNHGIVHVSAMLADALAGEILTNDFAAFKRSGTALFKHSIEWYSNPTPETYNRTPWNIFPQEANVFACETVGALQGNILLFLALHEYAHVVNRDTLTYGAWASMADVDQTAQAYGPTFDSKHREFLADTFAITHLSQWAEGKPTAWPNFAQAYLFMRWLQAVEEHCGQRSATHPPAKFRKENLVRVASQLSVAPPAEDYVAQIEDLVSGWLKQ